MHKYSLHFTKGYVAHPYWPELERLINIDKESGTRRARSEANRAKALNEYLTKHGMTYDQYLDLQKLAQRQFYMNGTGEIIIPEHQVYGCLAQAADLARSATRVASRDQIRSVLKVCGPIHTGKSRADGTWERFAVVTAGTGAKLSNQRALRRNEYIADFSGELAIEFDPHVVSPDRVLTFIRFAGSDVGLGASRKLGWGRFSVE